MDTVVGDDWIAAYSNWIQQHEAQLGDAERRSLGQSVVSSLWTAPASLLGFATTADVQAASALAAQRAAANRPGAPPPPPAAPIKPLQLRLNPHHLFYLLIRFEALGLPAGALDVRAPSAARPASYFPFNPVQSGGGRNGDDTMSLSSLRTSVSAVTAFSLGRGWWGLGPRTPAPDAPAKDLKVIYSAFTKIPAIRLAAPPPRSKMIRDFADCPGANAIPLDVFKNLQQLELDEVDPSTVIGWDRLSCQLRSLSCKRSGVEDVTDLLVESVVLDAARRRGERVQRKPRLVHSPEQETNEPLQPEQGESLGDKEGLSSLLPSQSGRSSPPPPTLPSLAWHFLRYLDLSHNNLTFLSATPLRALTALSSLDLSSNLLNAVPSSLSVLPRLQHVTLADNMIEAVRGSSTAEALRNVVALSLARNRLETLAGIEALTSLQRIDLRGNYLEEPSEVGRLAQLASISDVYVKHNPFTEEFPDWRVDVFVEFAKEGQGKETSLKIDGEVCGWFEKQRVAERAPRRAGGSTSPTGFGGSDGAPLSSPDEEAPTAISARTHVPSIRAAKHRQGLLSSSSAAASSSRRSDAVAGTPAEDAEPSRNKMVKRRRNRRVVDIEEKDGKKEIQKASTEAVKEPAMSDAEVIKAAAREGRLDAALDTSDPADLGSASITSNDTAAIAAAVPSIEAGVATATSRSPVSSPTDPAEDPALRARVRSRPNASALSARRRSGVTTSLFEPGSSSGSSGTSGKTTFSPSPVGGTGASGSKLGRSREEGDRPAMSAIAEDGAGGVAEGGSVEEDEGGLARHTAGDAWRRKIEALKGEVGDDWLRLIARGHIETPGAREGVDRADAGNGTGRG